MLVLPPDLRAEALALKGAGPFDPMQRGRIRTDKVQLPERMMDAPKELRSWIQRALEAASSELGPKGRRKVMVAGSPEVDAYLATLKPEQRRSLEKLRQTIRAIVPKAEECISYKIPAFRLDGRIVAGFSATARGCSYFPFSGSTLQSISKDLRGYSGTKGALHFDPVKGLPTTLVRKLLKARIAES